MALADSDRPIDDGFRVVGRRRVPCARHTRACDWLAMPARSPCSPSHSSTGQACTCSPGSLWRPRLLSRKRTRLLVATGNAGLLYAWLLVGAWRGVEAEAMKFINAGFENATGRSEGRVLALAGYAAAVLNNGLGRYEMAMDGAKQASDDGDFGYSSAALPELVEAASRCGKPDLAAAALLRLEERTLAAGTDWALGILARSRALVNAGDDADTLYREAIERLGRTRIRVELARARLLYGEWLRREGRRMDARDQLRAAHEMFSRFGAEAFAERGRRELLATGETARKRTEDTRDVLTPQEVQIARMASDRQTNPEIGAMLFISPRTVEYHLRKVFTKLDVSSRKELRTALAAIPDAGDLATR